MHFWSSIIFTDVNDRMSYIKSHVKESIYHMTCAASDWMTTSLSLSLSLTLSHARTPT